MKILCIGDSLALPGHLNRYEDTWIYKLKQNFPEHDFISYFKRQLTTDVLTTMGGGDKGIDNWPKGADCLEAYMPKIVIIQLGIVDCAPRLLKYFDKAILKLIPESTINTYLKLIKFTRKRKISNTLVSFENFQNNWINYLNRAVKINSKVIIISISLPDPSFLLKNPDILLNVNKYNGFLNSLADKFNNVIITEALKSENYKETIFEDGYHPNVIGHDLIFNELKKTISVIS